MGKAYEISVWEPHNGKFDVFIELIKSLPLAFLEAGVSHVELLTGSAGKDVGKVVFQHFKGLADNGSINEAIGEHPAMVKWREEHPGEFPAKLISHDLYQELDT